MSNQRSRLSQARANDGLFGLVTAIEKPARGGLFKLWIRANYGTVITTLPTCAFDSRYL